MIVPPERVPPPGKPRWEMLRYRYPGWLFRLYIQRQRWTIVRAQASGAYWLRYWNWRLVLHWGPWLWMLEHYVERQP